MKKKLLFFFVLIVITGLSYGQQNLCSDNGCFTSGPDMCFVEAFGGGSCSGWYDAGGE